MKNLQFLTAVTNVTLVTGEVAWSLNNSGGSESKRSSKDRSSSSEPP